MSGQKRRSPRSLLKAVTTLSPRTKTPGGVAFINDDEEELRQRRLEAHMRVMSPGTRPAVFEKLAICCFSLFLR